MTAGTTVMYASDFSPASLVALPHAIELAKSRGAELVIVHVLPSPIPVVAEMTFMDQDTCDRVFSAARAEAQEQLDALLARAREAGVRASGLVIECGIMPQPADEIVRAARDKQAGVLVLGTHGRSGVAKLFLGSVAARVVATAPCPVLTVRVPG